MASMEMSTLDRFVAKKLCKHRRHLIASSRVCSDFFGQLFISSLVLRVLPLFYEFCYIRAYYFTTFYLAIFSSISELLFQLLTQFSLGIVYLYEL